MAKNGGRLHRRGEGEEGLVGCIQKTDNNATVGYGEQVGVPICLEHGLLLPRKSGQAGRIGEADDNESMGDEEGRVTARDECKVPGGNGPHAFGQGAIYEDMEELL